MTWTVTMPQWLWVLLCAVALCWLVPKVLIGLDNLFLHDQDHRRRKRDEREREEFIERMTHGMTPEARAKWIQDSNERHEKTMARGGY